MEIKKCSNAPVGEITEAGEPPGMSDMSPKGTDAEADCSNISDGENVESDDRKNMDGDHEMSDDVGAMDTDDDISQNVSKKRDRSPSDADDEEVQNDGVEPVTADPQPKRRKLFMVREILTP